MNKTLASFALSKISWELNPSHYDHLEVFVPFVVSLMHRRKYKVIDIQQLCTDFTEAYGLEIPYHPIRAILTRTRRAGYINRSADGRYLPDNRRLVSDNFTLSVLEQERKFNRVVEI